MDSSFLQQLVDKSHAMSKRSDAERTYTLGRLIDTFKGIKPELPVCFGFGRIYPSTLASWRGIYSQLALGYSGDRHEQTAGAMLKEFESAVGKTFTGYKGGDYVMDRDTPVWVSNYGESSETAIVEVVSDEYRVTIYAMHCK